MDQRSSGEPFGFGTFEHTADIGLHAFGRTARELFEQAAVGLVSLLVADPETVQPVEERAVHLTHEGLEEGLIGWLQEILYLHEVAGFLPRLVRIDALDERELRASLRGERVDRSRHQPGLDVKAATYHDLRIRETRGPEGTSRFETRVVLDI